MVSVAKTRGAGVCAGVRAQEGGCVSGSPLSPRSLAFIPGIGSLQRLRANLAILCASKRRPQSWNLNQIL